ncbi:putative phosphoglucomutase protein [Neofusicoccum parvum UCRNP2]|uniref:Putative phosphoglucomutase protein n=1 Tax=Botryosphaeria parva (strain UCR-NP2) TaxID=1287680 RepID=R1EFE4_BOTPV|nr:putative phosphoglucomutase protein [Neofusicoccum parvum UCRNP2]
MAQPSIEKLAEEWLRLDKDPSTRDEIYRLLVNGEKAELETRLRKRIAFGTAGLRASMQAGFSRLNSLTIIQASQGLAAYLLDNVPDVKHRGVVIGRDARHNSAKFAKLTAAAMVAKGIRVWWYEDTVHTPLVPFGVGELAAAAGVMITASHNPAQDNGYKVYWGNGCQIIPPHDAGIAKAIEQNLEPVTWDTSVVDEGSLLIEGALGLVRDAYFRAVRYSAVPEDEPLPTFDDLKFVYTPMHGVGLPYMQQAVKDLGFGDKIHVVEAQAKPDPNFPTVKFPNPEEKGALDLSQKKADEVGSTLIIASDPDADRLAAAEKVDGKWHQFTGNQVGVLLASHVLSTYPTDKPLSKLAMLASAVSSRMLSTMAETEGFKFEETLTGFKWLGNIGLDLEAADYDVRFAYEEALGYMVPSVVHDKDSVSAAAFFLTATARWATEEGLTPWQKLQSLYAKYGHFEDANTYLVSPSPDTTNTVFAAIRALADPYPAQLGARKILRWRDLTVGFDSATSDNVPQLPVDKGSQMITCELDGDVRFTVRGSGTEPKIKLYIECRAKSSEEAQKGADEVLQDLLKEWFKPEENGLRLA